MFLHPPPSLQVWGLEFRIFPPRGDKSVLTPVPILQPWDQLLRNLPLPRRWPRSPHNHRAPSPSNPRGALSITLPTPPPSWGQNSGSSIQVGKQAHCWTPVSALLAMGSVGFHVLPQVPQIHSPPSLVLGTGVWKHRCLTVTCTQELEVRHSDSLFPRK